MNSQMLSFEDRFRDAAIAAMTMAQDLNALSAVNQQCKEALTEAKAIIAALLGELDAVDVDEAQAAVELRARDWLAKVG